MAITSTGYERAVSYAELGELLAHAGIRYSVYGAGSFVASSGPGDRQVTLQPGVAHGWGILDDSDAAVTVTASTVSSGDRWDLIALHRDWGEAETSIVVIPGASTLAIPARDTAHGVEDDQPLWLARFRAGETAVQELIDLRVWHGDGGLVARHLLARDYLTREGTRVWIQGVTWVLGFNSSGVPTWTPDSAYVGTTAPPYADGLVWVKPPA